MIVEITYWKKEISTLLSCLKMSLEELRSLDINSSPLDSPDEYARVNFELEKTLFFSGLAIRRIFEADKTTRKNNPNRIEWIARTVSNKLKDQNFRFQTRKPPEEPKNLSVYQLATELIHSEELEWSDYKTLNSSGFWLASENNRQRGPVFVEWPTFEDILGMVIHDQPDPFER